MTERAESIRRARAPAAHGHGDDALGDREEGAAHARQVFIRKRAEDDGGVIFSEHFTPGLREAAGGGGIVGAIEHDAAADLHCISTSLELDKGLREFAKTDPDLSKLRDAA